MQKYPGWSARENYAINKKKKRKRDKSVGMLQFLLHLFFAETSRLCK
uniref:Uncharacterized protein n=1 Tax=Parascaris equorum TaxID=6256 RepID=A0A914RND7_PAREQ